MRPFVIATLTFALAACASPPPAPTLTTASAADPNASVCHSETMTGSNLPHTVCVNRQATDSADASVAADRRAVTDLAQQVQHSPATRAGAAPAN